MKTVKVRRKSPKLLCIGTDRVGIRDEISIRGTIFFFKIEYL
jgi:hypothetical protein